MSWWVEEYPTWLWGGYVDEYNVKMDETQTELYHFFHSLYKLLSLFFNFHTFSFSFTFSILLLYQLKILFLFYFSSFSFLDCIFYFFSFLYFFLYSPLILAFSSFIFLLSFHFPSTNFFSSMLFLFALHQNHSVFPFYIEISTSFQAWND